MRANSAKLIRHEFQRLRPGHRLQPASHTNHRRLNTFRVIVEIVGVPAFDTEKFAVDTGAIAIIAAQDFVIANTECGLATVSAMRADRADVFHFPRTGLIAISAAGERAHRTNIDALTALVAFQVIAMIGRNQRRGSAIYDTESADTHALIAGAHAAEAENTTGPIVKNNGRPLLLIHMKLGFREAT